MKQNKILEMTRKAKGLGKYIFSGLDQIEGVDLNRTQRGVLMYIAFEGPLPMNEVSLHFGLEKGSFTQVADSLETISLIKRNRCEKDRRIIYLEITDDGKKMAEKIHKATTKRIDRIVSVLNEEQMKEFTDAIKIVTKNIDIIMKGV